jgi:DNA-binding NarL/FixJ family response regulator
MESADAPQCTMPDNALSMCPVPARVVLIGHSAARRTLLERVASLTIRASVADSALEVAGLFEHATYDLAIVIGEGDGPDAPWRAELSSLSARHPEMTAIVVSESPTLAQALEAMRAGAADLVAMAAPTDELATRLRAALVRARRTQQNADRIERLRKLCKQLNHARQEVSKQVGSLCSDMAEAYQELTDRMTHLATASEFGGVIRQELELESLLRIALEYLLAKTGPTNAAVFLPATSGEYTLGAYVNYDSPRETAEVLLDHLAGVIAPRFEHETTITHITNREMLRQVLGDKAEWIGDSELVVLPCHHDGECLAVIALFRDRHAPFHAQVTPLLQCVAEVFGRQLARVIHVHHRHLPKHKWGSLGDNERDDHFGDDIDLAA